MNEPDLNALIGSRICHDLISPLGAIGNGVELLSMSGISSAPEIALIAESVDNANARIRYFRVAFGAASPGSVSGNAELRSILRDLFRGNRVKVEWRLQEDVPRAEARLAFLVILCLESALPFGGKVQVTRTGDSWNVFGKAERLKVDRALWQSLGEGNSEAEIMASNVHFALVGPAARRLGRRVVTQFGETSVSVSF